MDTEIKFRVAAEDKARFERVAESERRSLSDWIRLTLLDASGPVFLTDHATGGDVSSGDRDERAMALVRRAKQRLDTRTPEQKMDDFYQSNMAGKGKK